MAVTFIAEFIAHPNQDQIYYAQNNIPAFVGGLPPDFSETVIMVPSIDYRAGDNYAPFEMWIAYLQALIDLPISKCFLGKGGCYLPEGFSLDGTTLLVLTAPTDWDVLAFLVD